MSGDGATDLAIWQVLAAYLFVVIILIIVGFVVKVPVEASDDTRVIIDHTMKVYSAPECFDDAGLTNHLEETTFGFAKELEYESESSCTTEALSGEKKPFLISIFQ